MELMMRQNTARKVECSAASTTGARTGLFVGTLLALGENGMAFVGLPAAEGIDLLKARSSGSIRNEDLGAQVVVLVEPGDIDQSVVIGVVQNSRSMPAAKRSVEVSMNLGTLEFEAQDRMVLRCGKASLTLTRDGKVLIRGTKVLNRASGVNRILGGSVQIN
jgi:hypothetical protein